MLEKTNKISVLSKMIGIGEDAADSPYVVPQNSVINFTHKMGLSEVQHHQQQQHPIENSTRYVKPLNTKCPHCENMAKNFLYLESLIRTNYNANNNCDVCHSSLKYLQYVNKSIMEVFGNFDSMAKAGKCFVQGRKGFLKIKQPRNNKLSATPQKSLNRKNLLTNKKSPSNTLKVNTKNTKSKSRVSSYSLREGVKASPSKSKNKKKLNEKQVSPKGTKKTHAFQVNSKHLLRKFKPKTVKNEK